VTSLVMWAEESKHSVTLSDMSIPGLPLVYVNESFCRMTEFDRKGILGQNCRALQVPIMRTYLPLQEIRLARGLCIRINTMICKHPLCLGTPLHPVIAYTIAQYSVPPRPSFIAIHAMQYWSWPLRYLFLS